MRKFLWSLMLLGVFAAVISAQTANPNTVIDGFYNVTSDLGAADASLLAKEMNLMFEEFNGLFRFDSKNMPSSFKVTSFASQEAYNNYVVSKLNRIREGAIYLHYNNPERRELIVFRPGGISPKILAHQAFIQFLRGFISNPPSWMRDGFAIFFSNLQYDKTNGKLIYMENLVWLETVKSWGEGAPSLESILMADIDGIPEHFQPASWALVSFFMNNADEEYRRLLFESFMLLSPSASAADNTRAIMQRMGSWINTETLKQDYDRYLASRKTFVGFIEEGRIAYDAKDPISAEKLFLSALEMRKDHYAPYYYLGLLAYEAQKYDEAEQYYRLTLQYGADQALLYYAMGLNALSAGRKDDARIFLMQASVSSPERYKTKAEELLKRAEYTP